MFLFNTVNCCNKLRKNTMQTQLM